VSGRPTNGDDFYKLIMSNDGADPAKAEAAARKAFPNWKGPGAGFSMNPVPDASASESVQPPGTVASQMTETESPIIPPTPEATPPQEVSETLTEGADLPAQERSQGIINKARDKRDLVSTTEDLVGLKKDLETAKTDIKRRGLPVTGAAAPPKIKRLEAQIKAAEKEIKELSAKVK